MAIKSGSNVWKMVLAGVILLVVTLQAGAATTALADPASPIAVTKTANPSPVVSGGLLTYTITMVNTGGAKLTNLVMTDQVNGVGVNQTPPALPQLTITSSAGNCVQGGSNGNLVTCNLGSLGGGASWTVTIAGQVTASNGATLNNTAAVSGTKSAQTFNTTATVQVPVQGGTGGGSTQPDLTINKTGPSSVAASSPLTYTLTVNNVGTANTANVKVVDTLPAGVTSASASGTSLFVCNVSGQTVTCTGGTVNAGANATITINATAPALAGSITNTAVVDPDNTIAESNELNNTSASVNTSVGLPPSGPLLDIKKTDGPCLPSTWCSGAGPDPITPGDQITYKIHVTNNATGTNSRADDVIVTDGTQGLEAASITASQVVVNGTVGNTGGCVVNAPQVRCNIRSLNSGGTLTITIKGTVISSAGSTIFNTATVTGNIKNTGVTSTASEATTVKPAVDLTITKADAPDPVCARSWPTDAQHLGQPAGAPAAAGTPPGLLAAPVCLGGLTYSFVVGNSGIAQATGVMVRDALPAGLIFDSYESTAGFVCAVDGSNAVTCTGGTIDAESTETLSFRVVAPPSLGVITNSITIDPNNSIFEPDETNNTATTTTNVATGVDLVVWKSDSNADDPPGVGAPSLTEGTATNLGDGYDPIATRGTQTVTIYVDNVGTQDTTGIRLRDTLPADTIFLSATSDPQHGFTCSHNGAATGGTVECTGGHLLGTAAEFYEEAGAPGPVPAGDQFATIKIRFFARASVGSMLNEVRVDPLNEIAEANELNNTATDTTTVTAGDADKGAYHQLTVAKTQTSPAPGPVATNGILIYDLTVSNLGTDPISNVIVRDTLPSGTRFIEVKDAGGNTADGFSCVHDGAATGGVITCSGGDLNGSINQIPGVSGTERHITIKVFAPNIPGGITNQAEVDPNNLVPEGNEFDNNTQANTTVAPCADQAACTAGNAVYELTIVKDQNRPTIARNGLETYTLLVSNLGSDPISDIKVVDILPAGTRFFDAKDTAVPPSNPAAFTCSHDGSATSGIVTCTGGDLSGTDGSLAVAGVPTSRSIQIRAFMPDTPGTYTNRSVVDPDNAIPEGNEFNNESSIQTAVQNAGPNPYIDLKVDKAQTVILDQEEPGDDTVHVTPGGLIMYTLTVTNAGEGDAYNVTVRDFLPENATYHSALDIGADPGKFTCGLVPGGLHTLDCSGGTLPAGNSRTINVFLVAPSGLDATTTNQEDIKQLITNSAFIDPENAIPEGDESNNADVVRTTVRSQVNLTVEKEGPENANQNSTDTYTITVKNNKVWGDGDIAVDVVVIDPLPVGLIPLGVAAGANFTCAVLENPVNFVRCVGDLEPDQEATITITVFVTQESGTLDNEACVDPDHTVDETNELDNCDTKTTNVNATPPPTPVAPNLHINKTVDKGNVTAGESLTYTLSISNSGDGNADGPVTVTDTLPPSTVATFGNANPSGGFTCSAPVGGVLTCTAAAGLAPGAFGTITVEMTVVDPLPAGTTSIVNQASVAAGVCAAVGCEDESVNSTRLLDNSTTATSVVGGSAVDLVVATLIETDTPDPVNRAEQLTHTIVVTNAGTAQAGTLATPAVVRITLPAAGITVIGAEGTNGFNCGAPAGGFVNCSGVFPPGGNTVITLTSTVLLGAPDDLVLIATADPDNVITESDELNNTGTATTTVSGDTCTTSPCIDLVAAQIFDTPDGPVNTGANVKYTFVVVNVGDTHTNTDPEGAHIHFEVAGDFTLASITVPAGFVCSINNDLAGLKEWFCDGNLAPGAGVSFEISATAGAAGGSITATGDADQHGTLPEFIESNNGPISTTTAINP